MLPCRVRDDPLEAAFEERVPAYLVRHAMRVAELDLRIVVEAGEVAPDQVRDELLERPLGLQFASPPPVCVIVWPILSLWTIIPSAAVPKIPPFTTSRLVSDGLFGWGSSRQGKELGLQPRMSVAPLRTRMLPATVMCVLWRPKAAISTEWRVTIMLRETETGPCRARQTPRTTTVRFRPVSSPGRRWVPWQTWLRQGWRGCRYRSGCRWQRDDPEH